MSKSPTEIYQKYVSTHFHRSGRKTEKFIKTQNRFFRKNYLSFLPERKDAKIIDLGCGLGNFLMFLRSAGYKNIQGIDASQECVDFCQKEDLDAGVSAILPYLRNTGEKFDVFTLNDVLEHMTKDEMWEVLSLIREHLTNDGVCIIKVPNMSQPFLGIDSRYIDITHEIGFTESSLRQVLKISDFKDIVIFGPDIYVYPNLKNRIAKIVAKTCDKLVWVLFALYGRTETKIFTKHLVAVVRK